MEATPNATHKGANTMHTIYEASKDTGCGQTTLCRTLDQAEALLIARHEQEITGQTCTVTATTHEEAGQ